MSLSPILVATLGLGPGISSAQVAALGLLQVVAVAPPVVVPPTLPPGRGLVANGGLAWPKIRTARARGRGVDSTEAIGFASALVLSAGGMPSEEADALGIANSQALVAGSGETSTEGTLWAVPLASSLGWADGSVGLSGRAQAPLMALARDLDLGTVASAQALALGTGTGQGSFASVSLVASGSGLVLSLGSAPTHPADLKAKLCYPWFLPAAETDHEAAAWLCLPRSAELSLTPPATAIFVLPITSLATVELGHGLVVQVELETLPPATALVPACSWISMLLAYE